MTGNHGISSSTRSGGGLLLGAWILASKWSLSAKVKRFPARRASRSTGAIEIHTHTAALPQVLRPHPPLHHMCFVARLLGQTHGASSRAGAAAPKAVAAVVDAARRKSDAVTAVAKKLGMPSLRDADDLRKTR